VPPFHLARPKVIEIVVYGLESKPLNEREGANARQVHLDPSPDDELEFSDRRRRNGVQ
jgi:hypothetical protein